MIALKNLSQDQIRWCLSTPCFKLVYLLGPEKSANTVLPNLCHSIQNQVRWQSCKILAVLNLYLAFYVYRNLQELDNFFKNQVKISHIALQ